MTHEALNELAAIVRRWQDEGGDAVAGIEARDKIVFANMRLVPAALQGEFQLSEDVIAAGRLGLVQAATEYDPSRGAKFSGFAYVVIRHAALSYVFKDKTIPMPENAHRPGYLADPKHKAVAEAVAKMKLVKISKGYDTVWVPDRPERNTTDTDELLALLFDGVTVNPDHIEALLGMYGACGRPRTALKQVAKKHGITRSRVGQWVDGVIKKIALRAQEDPRLRRACADYFDERETA